MTRALEPKVPESLEARPLGAQTKNRDFPLVASAGRQQSADGTLDSLRASSSTAEQRTLNPQVSGSNPEGRTSWDVFAVSNHRFRGRGFLALRI